MNLREAIPPSTVIGWKIKSPTMLCHAIVHMHVTMTTWFHSIWCTYQFRISNGTFEPPHGKPDSPALLHHPQIWKWRHGNVAFSSFHMWYQVCFNEVPGVGGREELIVRLVTHSLIWCEAINFLFVDPLSPESHACIRTHTCPCMNHLATKWTLNTTLCPLCLVGEPEILAENCSWPHLFTKFSNWLLNYSVLSTFFPFLSPPPPFPLLPSPLLPPLPSSPSPPLPSPPPLSSSSPLPCPSLPSPPSFQAHIRSRRRETHSRRPPTSTQQQIVQLEQERYIHNLNRDSHAVHFD